MSRLTFTGNIIKSTGEYLPAPYINRIYVSQGGLAIENFIFIDNIIENYAVSNGAIRNSSDLYNKRVLDLHYYILLVNGYSEDEYELIKKGDLNPLSFYHDKVTNEYQGQILLLEITTDGAATKDFYDDVGNVVNGFSINTEIASGLSSPKSDFWEDSGDFKQADYVFCFASTFDYSSNSIKLDEPNFNQRLFDLYVGDVSYERIFDSEGNLAIDEQFVFVDSLQNYYDETPLQSIDYTAYKIGDIDHKYIKKNIEELLEDYSEQYNSETGNTQLKNVMNSIYTTLETSYLDYDILNKLEFIRRSFPNKTPSNDVGKLYKRFSKRLFNINNTVKSTDPVYKQLKYNSKIVDLETLSADELVTSNETLSATDLIYTDWQATNLDLDGENSVVFGYFFFDYEKALRTQSKLSEHLDVNKLERSGIHIPYSSFKLQEATIGRTDSSGAQEKKIKVVFDSPEMPLATNITFDPDTATIDTSFQEALAITPYGSSTSSETTPSNGFMSHLITRKYTPIYDTDTNIENYRLVLFELLEYFGSTTSTGYSVELSLYDTSESIMGSLSGSLSDALDLMKEYQTLVNEQCVFNSDLEKFNDFFTTNIINAYSDSPQSAPWYVAPITYIFQMDLFYNLFDGDATQMEEAAKKIINKINPVNGNVNSIDSFVAEMDDLLVNIYNGGTFADITTPSFSVTFSMPTAQEIVSDSSTYSDYSPSSETPSAGGSGGGLVTSDFDPTSFGAPSAPGADGTGGELPEDAVDMTADTAPDVG
jgi:hypothetical protein